MHKETLGAKQKIFTLLLAQFVIWAYDQGYELTYGDAYRDRRAFGSFGVRKTYGHKNSNHKRRLAVDLNLFIENEYMTQTEDYAPLGEKWESMGGTWGGRFNDGNHFSLEHDGFK